MLQSITLRYRLHKNVHAGKGGCTKTKQLPFRRLLMADDKGNSIAIRRMHRIPTQSGLDFWFGLFAENTTNCLFNLL